MSTFAFFIVFIAAGSAYAQKVPVTVYYESLCPDSIKFYTNQLYPAWNSSLKSFMDLQLVPFGKSNYTHMGDNYTFTCHHGEKECVGNKVQACALKLIPATPDMDLQVKYINCLMAMAKSSVDMYPTKSCAEEVKLGGDVLEKIESCATTNEGNDYLAALGDKTMKFQNPLISVPTVVVDHYDAKEKDDARNDFKSVLCAHIKDGKPAECGKSGSSVAMYPAALLVPLLLAFSIRL
ncbi:gamma-interferon-inducible lysosomal thiol reductase 1 [Rhodnius prolixus]|uniref:Putative gamma-interferon-inducible lysosomal thiol reductase n=2 Tax=Rhodnius prolixus TaxID=13249 RepID=R4G4A3_RHOPR